jgi:hypothetical protein
MSDTRAPDLHPGDRAVERLLGHPQQRRASRLDLADRHRDRRVAEEPVELRPDVHRHDVALGQDPLRRRDPVDHLSLTEMQTVAGYPW